MTLSLPKTQHQRLRKRPKTQIVTKIWWHFLTCRSDAPLCRETFLWNRKTSFTTARWVWFAGQLRACLRGREILGFFVIRPKLLSQIFEKCLRARKFQNVPVVLSQNNLWNLGRKLKKRQKLVLGCFNFFFKTSQGLSTWRKFWGFLLFCPSDFVPNFGMFRVLSQTKMSQKVECLPKKRILNKKYVLSHCFCPKNLIGLFFAHWSNDKRLWMGEILWILGRFNGTKCLGRTIINIIKLN